MPKYSSYAGELSSKLADYRALGQKEGSKNRPAQNAAGLDQHEGALRSEAESWLTTEQRLFDMQLVESSKGTTEAKQKAIELRMTVDQLVNDDSARSSIDAELAGDRPKLVRAVEQRLRTETAYKYFRAQNDIHDEPFYPESVWWHFGVLAVLGLVETVTNAFFYENSQGLLGGFFVALGIAALNMATAMLLGNMFRFKNLASVDKKVIGWIALAAFVFTTLLFNALFASFRSEYQLVTDPTELKELGAAFQRAWPEAMLIFRADMQFRDLWSFLLFGLGVLLSIAAFWKGYTLDDRYPGHGHVARERKKAEQAEHEIQDVLRQKIKDLLHHRKAAVHAAIHEPGTQMGMLARRIADLTHAKGALESQASSISRDYDLVRDAYRQANASIRAVPAPAYFSDRQGLVTRVDGSSAERVISELAAVQEELKALRDANQGPLNSKLNELQGDASEILKTTFQVFVADARKEAEDNIARMTPALQRVQAA
jgi:hypothetical protein